ncbi:hypothetical protein P171DRAFT_437726 [Karstenula rhodostoma CBS 690.94]|uniref:F-box domain-containing protein n=1 Tax=Karstenula rhodostoma CBS 690.94 TaxID=1392251 RepID=A0A9P4P5L8_9PLEO|nr:hypothetical protein P171DRAFT_437726 [Karstenula rhodostoma CBS 690.94]
MDTLPLELIERISSSLSLTDLKATLLLSRKFQHAAERYSGAFCNARLTSDLATTQKFFATYNSHRFLYLRSIFFDTWVPGIQSEDETDETDEALYQPCRDSEKVLQNMDEEFTKQINILFSILSTLESQVCAEYGPGNIHLTIYTPTRYLCAGECYHRKFMSWRVHLLSPSTIPRLLSVRAFTLEVPADDISYPNEGGTFSCHVDYRILLDIARKCLNLDTLVCRLGGREWLGSFHSHAMRESCSDWAGPRRDSRHDFAKALHNINEALPHLRYIQLNFLYPLRWVEEFDHHLALPDLVKPGLFDPFSSALRSLSYQLRTMDLRVVADETLFWPTGGSEDECVWPNMRKMNIMFNNSHPSGSWYFGGHSSGTTGYEITPEHYPPLKQTHRDRANDKDEETEYVSWGSGDAFSMRYTRVFPHDYSLVKFLEAFAKAAARMPLLSHFVVWTPINLDVDEFKDEYPDLDPKTVSKDATEHASLELAWGVAYTAPEAEHRVTWSRQHDKSVRNIWWKVGNWQPQPKLRLLFQKIGQREYIDGLREHWNNLETQNNSLDYRDSFKGHAPI